MLLAEADRRKAAGTLGAFLREKRIYSSMLSNWRKQVGAVTWKQALGKLRKGPGAGASVVAFENPNEIKSVFWPMARTSKLFAGDYFGELGNMPMVPHN